MKVARSEVVAAVQNALNAYDEWEAQDGPWVQWLGKEAKELSLAVAIAIDDLCAYCAVTEVDDDAKEIIFAIDAMQLELAAWKEASDVSYGAVHPSGTPELRATVGGLRDAIETHTVRLPENIRDLMDGGNCDEVICKIYGFLDANGRPDMVKLSQEKRTPGMHFNAETWVPPWLHRRRNETNARWEQRSPVLHVRVGQPILSPRPIAPESIDELLSQNVEPQQIALMKGMTLEEVETHARKQGVPVAGRTVRDPSKRRESQAAMTKRRAELKSKTHPEIADMEERIAACFLDDISPDDIAAGLQATFPDLTVHHVAEMIRKFQELEASAT